MTTNDLTYGQLENGNYWAGNVLKISGETNKRINDFWRKPKVRMYTQTYPETYEVLYVGNKGTYLDKRLFAYFCDWLSYEAARICTELFGIEYMRETRAYFRDLKGNKYDGIAK